MSSFSTLYSRGTLSRLSWPSVVAWRIPGGLPAPSTVAPTTVRESVMKVTTEEPEVVLVMTPTRAAPRSALATTGELTITPWSRPTSRRPREYQLLGDLLSTEAATAR